MFGMPFHLPRSRQDEIPGHASGLKLPSQRVIWQMIGSSFIGSCSCSPIRRRYSRRNAQLHAKTVGRGNQFEACRINKWRRKDHSPGWSPSWQAERQEAHTSFRGRTDQQFVGNAVVSEQQNFGGKPHDELNEDSKARGNDWSKGSRKSPDAKPSPHTLLEKMQARLSDLRRVESGACATRIR